MVVLLLNEAVSGQANYSLSKDFIFEEIGVRIPYRRPYKGAIFILTIVRITRRRDRLNFAK